MWMAECVTCEMRLHLPLVPLIRSPFSMSMQGLHQNERTGIDATERLNERDTSTTEQGRVMQDSLSRYPRCRLAT